MTIRDGSLSLLLKLGDGLKDGLEQVEVLASAVNRLNDPLLRIVGTVEGEEGLESLLDAVGIDHVLGPSSDAFPPTFSTRTAYDLSPKRIVEDLKEKFAKAAEISQKIYSGEKLTDDEESFRPPTNLTVCASAVQMEQGTEIAAAWFKKKAGNNRAQSAAQ
jgi:hypothetical protein